MPIPKPIPVILVSVLLFSCANTVKKKPQEPVQQNTRSGYFNFQTHQMYLLVPDTATLHAKLLQWGPVDTDTASTDELSYYQEPLSDNKIQNEYLLTTKRGQQLKIATNYKKIWLDAASTAFLRYQSHQLHSVALVNGNAYYETEKDSLIIDLPKDSLKLRGTPSSIVTVNNYANEPNIVIALKKGKLIIAGKYKNKHIKKALSSPGDQIVINRATGKAIHVPVDSDDLPQWEKTEIYRFSNADMQSILRTAERWYNMPVIYKDSIPNVSIVGSLLYISPVESLLQVLEANAPIKCQIKNDTITIVLIKK